MTINLTPTTVSFCFADLDIPIFKFDRLPEITRTQIALITTRLLLRELQDSRKMVDSTTLPAFLPFIHHNIKITLMLAGYGKNPKVVRDAEFISALGRLAEDIVEQIISGLVKQGFVELHASPVPGSWLMGVRNENRMLAFKLLMLADKAEIKHQGFEDEGVIYLTFGYSPKERQDVMNSLLGVKQEFRAPTLWERIGGLVRGRFKKKKPRSY